jgi:hypothetical protein
MMTDRQYGGLELHQFFLLGVRQALLVSLGDGYFCITAVLRSSSRKVSGLTPTAVFALATPKSPIDP